MRMLSCSPIFGTVVSPSMIDAQMGRASTVVDVSVTLSSHALPRLRMWMERFRAHLAVFLQVKAQPKITDLSHHFVSGKLCTGANLFQNWHSFHVEVVQPCFGYSSALFTLNDGISWCLPMFITDM